MAKRGKKGNLQRMLDDNDTAKTPKSSRSLNQGRGQEITGVTLPADGGVKGWEFGEDVRLAVANVEGKFYGLQGTSTMDGSDVADNGATAVVGQYFSLP